MRFLSLLAVLFLVAGCDSDGDAPVLDDEFYVGTWTLSSISDGGGDRTADVSQSLDGLTIEFESDGGFALDADFSDAVNASGQADLRTTGTYQARAETPSLFLTSGGVSALFTANAVSEDRVSLTAPGLIVGVVLAGLPFEFEGDTTITVQRR